MSPFDARRDRCTLGWLALVAAWTALSSSALAAEGKSLPRSAPEAQGVSSAAVLAFVDAADRRLDSLHSFMLVRHGHVVAEGWWTPYDAASRHELYSLSKSFTSTAVGIAIAEGKLSLHDPVLKFFPDDAPAQPSGQLRAMRVSDLLRMSTGHQAEPPRNPGENWARAFLAQPVPFKPGTHFMYNTSATYMASAIVQKVTGQTVLDYLRPRLFEPLGIEDPVWGNSPQGVTLGGYGLSVRTEDIARFGQLYLQKGRWHGKQLVPEAWVAAATAMQTSNGSNPASDWDQGYGYQFWRCRHGAYRGDGAFGQYCIVLPEQDAVIAITGGLRNMQEPLDLVWEHLLPAMRSAEPLPADDDARARLEKRLKALTLRPQEGSASPAEGVWGKRFVFPANQRKLEALTLERSGGRDGDGAEADVTLVLRMAGAEHRLACGRGAWRKGRLSWPRLSWDTPADQPVAVSGAWAEAGTYVARVCFHETPFVVTLRLKFEAGRVRLTSEANVGFGPTRDPEIVGKAE